MEEEVLKWVDTLEGDEACSVCMYSDVCNHTGITSTPDGPVYAPCCDGKLSDICDYDLAHAAYCDTKCDECTGKACTGCEYQH